MPQDAGQFLESLARDVINIIGQLGRTLRDMIFQPGIFARDIVAPSGASQKYIGAYTFLIVTGFIGTNALFAILKFDSWVVVGLNSSDSVQNRPSVVEQLSVLPTAQALLVFGIPLVIAIIIISRLFRIVISRSKDNSISQAVYYTGGVQYFLVSIFYVMLYLFEWDWGEWEYASWMVDVLQGWSAFVLIILLLPTALLFRISLSAVQAKSRRLGRGFIPLAFFAALIVQSLTASLLWVGMTMYAIFNPIDLRSFAVLQVEFLGRPVVSDNRIKTTILVTNKTPGRLLIQSGGASVTTSSDDSSGGYHGQPKEWVGRLYDPRVEADVVTLAAGETLALRFDGAYKGDVGMAENARGRLEVEKVNPDGSVEKIAGNMRRDEPLWGE